jgi:hypothetical protein
MDECAGIVVPLPGLQPTLEVDQLALGEVQTAGRLGEIGGCRGPKRASGFGMCWCDSY